MAALRAALDPSLPRILHFDGAGHPRPCAVPIGSADEQPLYGALGVSKVRESRLCATGSVTNLFARR